MNTNDKYKKYNFLTNKVALSITEQNVNSISVSLVERRTRTHDDKKLKYGRQPAKGSLISFLEKNFQTNAYKVATFDGYIIPKNQQKVTRVLFCREYETQHSNSLSIEQILYQCTKQLLNDTDLIALYEFADKLKSAVDIIFVPYNFPRSTHEENLLEISLIKDIYNQKIKFSQVNIQGLRKHLEECGKRKTYKKMTFSPTKLEYYLANSEHDGKGVIAFPGDADGILFDKEMNIKCILEYKADTQNNNISEEKQDKYKDDSTRFEVLDDLVVSLKVPLIIVFWSDRHTNSKLIVRFQKESGKFSEYEKVINYVNNYQTLSSEIYTFILNSIDEIESGTYNFKKTPLNNKSQI